MSQNPNQKLEISALEVYYFKVSTKESIFLQKEDRLSFCINLEVVILEVEIRRFVFWEKLWLDNFVSRLTDL